jgi:hypothetical protein
MLSRTGIQAAVCTIVAVASAAIVGAHAPSGAIFTTLADGSEVNVNQYSSKEDVYLNGGPGIGAPATAAALDDGTYYFQVTDPSGKTLLSTDNIECRRFRVTDGLITYEPGPGCTTPHLTGTDSANDHGGDTIQLMPYADTPNRGGVYKVWVTFTEDYGCTTEGGCKHGFLPRHSKTDNFKVREVPIIEIDAYFLDGAGEKLSGRYITWIDTLGASNVKYSYYSPFFNVVEAHVEALEVGTHTIVIENQPGCTVGRIYQGNWEGNDPATTYVGYGPQAVAFTIRNSNKADSPYLNVYCE